MEQKNWDSQIIHLKKTEGEKKKKGGWVVRERGKERMKERGEREMLISLPDYFGSNVVMVQIKKLKMQIFITEREYYTS